ncbi:MAG: pitrilysin family protein [Snowella sp.]|nr:pitrilysin family protein [Snowella sp.]
MTSTLVSSPCLNAPTVHRLPNGLTIIAEQLPVEAVNLNIWLQVGSVLEDDGINGMAHFLEHMIFKGSSQLASGDFEKAIEERGAVTNAATSQEYTHYYITAAPKDFGDLAPLQLEVLLNASIADEPFEREKLVVLEEIRRAEDNPQRRVFNEVMQVGFEQSPYCRPVLGSTSIIEQLKPQQMRNFHANWYQPSRMTAAVVGNLPTEELIGIVAESFSQTYTIKSPAEVLPIPTLQAWQPFTSIVSREGVDETLQQARLILMWRVPGLQDLEQTYALDVLAAILGRGKVSRLVWQLREERGLLTSISAHNMTYGNQGLFYIAAQLPSENVETVEAAILAQIQQIQENSVTEIELARIRTQVANRFIFSNERPSDRANLYGYYYSQLQSLEPALTYPQVIQSLQRESLQRVAQHYLSPENYGRVVVRCQ